MLHKKVSVEKRNEFACEAFNRRNEIPKKLKLSKRYIEKLLRHYFCESAVEKFYDSEPDFDDEEYNMYLDYQNKFRITGRSFWELVTNMDENGDIANKKFSKQEHTPEEYKHAYEKVTQMYEAYEERNYMKKETGTCHKIMWTGLQDPFSTESEKVHTVRWEGSITLKISRRGLFQFISASEI